MMAAYDQPDFSSPMNVDDDKFVAEDQELILSYPASDELVGYHNSNFSLFRRNILVFLLIDIIERFDLVARTPSECRSLLQDDPSLESQLVELWRKGQGFRTICSHPFFQTPRHFSKDIIIENAAIAATERSWGCTFSGDSATVLLATIRSYLRRRGFYSPCTVIVNSSGTGKSRMVDELGKTVVVVPMCLRKGRDGFPPPDVNLRKWLEKSFLKHGTSTTTRALSSALCKTTHEALKAIVQSLSSENTDNPGYQSMLTMAYRFRLHMTERQSFKGHGKYRTNFHGRVVELAEQFIHEDSGTVMSDLVDFLYDCDPNSLVVFAFDEPHGLQPIDGWSMLDGIRAAFRLVYSRSIFSLFLSTSGELEEFSSPQRYESSSRIASGPPDILPPITEVGFDQLARRAKEGELTLETVTGLEFMSHLGRPLFGSLWDAGNEVIQENILDCAKRKLLGTDSNTISDDAQSLACLAVRLALEFSPITYQHRKIEMKQIECHMRMCLGADPGFQRTVSVAASEPLLAEAAANVLIKNSAHELASHLDVWGINRGSRGELVAMLLVLQARDKACETVGRRYLTVREFLEALLPEHYHAELSLPMHASGTVLPSMDETFKNSHVWFNHFTKVDDYDIINVEYLWRVAVRGVAILCAGHQRGVELVIPVVYSGTRLQRSSMTAILIQVKNDKAFGASVVEYLFDNMDPHDLGLFSTGEEGNPVIRMVFALASSVSVVKFVSPQRESTSTNSAPKAASHATYDIWVAGLSSDVLRPIDKDNINDFKALLPPCPHMYDIYSSTDVDDETVRIARGNLRRQANPATLTDDVFFSKYLDLSTSDNDLGNDGSQTFPPGQGSTSSENGK